MGRQFITRFRQRRNRHRISLSFCCLTTATFRALHFAFSERTYCRDRVKACGNALAADLDACTNYTEWANEQCPKTCGICTDFGKLLCCLGVKGGLKTETRSGEVERCSVKTESRSGEVERCRVKTERRSGEVERRM